MRRDNHLLEDIRIAAADIAEFISGMRLQDYLADSKTQAAVERQLITIGEAANRVSTEFKHQHLEVPRKRLAQIRNFYIHGYERLLPESVWGTAKRFIPRIGRLVAELVPTEDESPE